MKLLIWKKAKSLKKQLMDYAELDWPLWSLIEITSVLYYDIGVINDVQSDIFPYVAFSKKNKTYKFFRNFLGRNEIIFRIWQGKLIVEPILLDGRYKTKTRIIA